MQTLTINSIWKTYADYEKDVLNVIKVGFKTLEWFKEDAKFNYTNEQLYNAFMFKYNNRQVRYVDKTSFLSQFIYRYLQHFPKFYLEQQTYLDDKLKQFADDENLGSIQSGNTDRITAFASRQIDNNETTWNEKDLVSDKNRNLNKYIQNNTNKIQNRQYLLIDEYINGRLESFFCYFDNLFVSYNMTFNNNNDAFGFFATIYDISLSPSQPVKNLNLVKSTIEDVIYDDDSIPSILKVADMVAGGTGKGTIINDNTGTEIDELTFIKSTDTNKKSNSIIGTDNNFFSGMIIDGIVDNINKSITALFENDKTFENAFDVVNNTLATKANSDAVVNLLDNQNVKGVKIFEDGISLLNADYKVVVENSKYVFYNGENLTQIRIKDGINDDEASSIKQIKSKIGLNDIVDMTAMGSFISLLTGKSQDGTKEYYFRINTYSGFSRTQYIEKPVNGAPEVVLNETIWDADNKWIKTGTTQFGTNDDYTLVGDGNVIFKSQGTNQGILTYNGTHFVNTATGQILAYQNEITDTYETVKFIFQLRSNIPNLNNYKLGNLSDLGITGLTTTKIINDITKWNIYIRIATRGSNNSVSNWSYLGLNKIIVDANTQINCYIVRFNQYQRGTSLVDTQMSSPAVKLAITSNGDIIFNEQSSQLNTENTGLYAEITIPYKL